MQTQTNRQMGHVVLYENRCVLSAPRVRTSDQWTFWTRPVHQCGKSRVNPDRYLHQPVTVLILEIGCFL